MSQGASQITQKPQNRHHKQEWDGLNVHQRGPPGVWAGWWMLWSHSVCPGSEVRSEAAVVLEEDAPTRAEAPVILLGPLENKICVDELSDGVQSMDVRWETCLSALSAGPLSFSLFVLGCGLQSIWNQISLMWFFLSLGPRPSESADNDISLLLYWSDSQS